MLIESYVAIAKRADEGPYVETLIVKKENTGFASDCSCLLQE